MTAYSEQYAEGRRRITVSLSKPETEALLAALAAGRMALEAEEILTAGALAALDRGIGKIDAADRRLSSPLDPD